VLDKSGGTNWNHLNASKTGGLVDGGPFMAGEKVHFSFSVPCRLGNITEKTPTVWGPDFDPNVPVGVSGCTITCPDPKTTRVD